MGWFAIVLFSVIGIALIAQNRRHAEIQSMLAGGRIAPGCIIAEGVALLTLALAVALLGR